MLFLIAATLISAIAAFFDWRRGEIPNRLTYGALALAPVAHAAASAVVGGSWLEALTAAGLSILGALICGLFPALAWHRGLLGGGDVKLFAALGALLHPFTGFEAQVYAYYVAAFFVPIGLLYKGTFWQSLKNSGLIVMNAFRPRSKRIEVNPTSLTWFRLGPAIFVGCLLTTAVHWSP